MVLGPNNAIHLGHNQPISQGYLGHSIQSLFPGKKVITNSRKGAQIKSPDTGYYLELDYWLPDFNLAFEYQDPHHYVTSWYSFRPVNAVQKKDEWKVQFAKEKGVTLIIVPCWWDGKYESLVASIKKERPEMLPDFFTEASPIASEPPEDFFIVKTVPDVGELMLASLPESSFDPSNWWLSEKYDGYRACYHPAQNVIYSRFGRKVPIYDPFLRQFPSHFVDGEIWFGREMFLESQKLTQNIETQSLTGEDAMEEEKNTKNTKTKKIDIVKWDHMKMITVDYADSSLRDLSFENRFEIILSSLDSHLPSLTVLGPSMCKDKKQLHRSLEIILETGGEGVILRKTKSPYFCGRSDSLVKFKTHRDQEALVLGLQSKNDYILKLPNGIVFYATMQKKRDEAKKRPNIGDIVTFKYSKISPSGSPQQANIERTRNELTWMDVLLNFNSTLPRKRSADMVIERTNNKSRIVNGYWNVDEGKNARIFFDNLAKQKGKDPLNPETWYKLQFRDVNEAQGNSLLRYYGGSMKKALMNVYPNIGLEIHKFSYVTHKYWLLAGNRRKFFEGIAAKRNFDPLKVVNWYGITSTSLFKYRGGAAIFAYYGSVAEGIKDAFPELDVDTSQFDLEGEKKWRSPKRRREFMDKLAAKKGFDPLVPDNWYSVTFEDIVNEQGGTLLNFYSKSTTALIVGIYPDIGLDESRFPVMRNGYWEDPKNVKRFFDEYAFKRNFNPLIAENWYNVKTRDIHAEKGGYSVLHHKSFARVLKNVYPNIGIEEIKFAKVAHGYFKSPENRRNFLIKFARSKGLDPFKPETWYSVFQESLQKEKGGKALLYYYSHSLKRAVEDLFPEIGIDHHKFRSALPDYLRNKTYQRECFDAIAQKYNLDPLNPETWYTLSATTLEGEGKRTIVSYYNGSVFTTLEALYPDIGLRREIYYNFKKRAQFKLKYTQK